MYYYQYDTETGKVTAIAGYDAGFDNYVTSETNYEIYGISNLTVVNGEIVVAIEGYRQVALNTLNDNLFVNRVMNIGNSKYYERYDSHKAVLFLQHFSTTQTSYRLPCYGDETMETRSIYEFSNQTDAVNCMKDIIDYMAEVDLFETEKTAAINAATTQAEVEAISLTPPTFSLS
jgi:hypothetical protein